MISQFQTRYCRFRLVCRKCRLRYWLFFSHVSFCDSPSGLNIFTSSYIFSSFNPHASRFSGALEAAPTDRTTTYQIGKNTFRRSHVSSSSETIARENRLYGIPRTDISRGMSFAERLLTTKSIIVAYPNFAVCDIAILEFSS